MIKKPPLSDRKPRADAVKNRARILEVAKEAFITEGADASLDDIARKAGVGPGTLYRHFPAREILLAAVFDQGAERLASAAEEFAKSRRPTDALRAWMMLFVDHIAEKHLIAAALNALLGDRKELLAPSHLKIWEAVRALVNRAIQAGEIRADLDPIDLLRALIGVANVATSDDWEVSARRLVDILISGSRPV